MQVPAGELKPESPAVSRDPQFGVLLDQLEEGVDAAIAASAFRSLLTTVPTSNDSSSWELPVAVRLAVAADPLSSKFVCVDKPLIPRAMTLRRKHEVLYKAALVSLSTSAGRGWPRSLNDRNSDQDRLPVRAGTGPANAAQQGPGGISHATDTPALPFTAAEIGVEPSGQHDVRQPGGRPPQQAARRGVRYDLWRIGRFRAILRSHEVAQISGSTRKSSHSKPGDLPVNQQDAPVIARAKVEYTANEQVWSLRAIVLIRRCVKLP